MGHHVVIGTAGHVDHGKTALVKALTGTDTDRWEEEKRRGITIDLGFAHLRLGDDLSASVVDVPGHEDFVRNMVAGATGVDVALLVVAADEGVMPQTVEHLAILQFLDVRTGVVAVTKTDLVEPDWLELVIEDLTERLADTGTAWEPVCPVSTKTGDGVTGVMDALSRASTRAAARTDADLFRLPVDRVFSVAGAGTVVTGTTWAGTVATGDPVRVLPDDAAARVRGIEVHGRPADRAVPGRRTALALVGLDRSAGKRGSTVVSDAGWRASRRIDVDVTMLGHAKPLTQRSRLRLHLGTAEVMARVTPAGGDIPPGGKGMVRLRLEAPVVCRWGDRGVLRAYSPVTTIGGCLVVDPWPSPRPRRPRDDGDRLAPDPALRVAAGVRAAGPGGVGWDELPIRFGVAPGAEREVVDRVTAVDAVLVGKRLYPIPLIDEALTAARGAVDDYHRDHPLHAGMPLEAFRRTMTAPDIAEFVRERMEADREIVVRDGSVRREAFVSTLAGRDAEYGVVVESKLTEAGPRGVDLDELQGAVGAPAADLAEYFVRQGTAVRVGGDRYYDRKALDEVVATVIGELKRRGSVSPGDLRDVLGLSRKYLIPLLEWLDNARITVRVGDVREMGPASAMPKPDGA